MALRRAAALLVVAIVSATAFAADPNSSPATSPDTQWRTTLDSVRLVPWFTGTTSTATKSTGTKRANPQLNSAENPKIVWRRGPVPLTPGALSGVSCLTLRTYKVKRTERLSDNESGMRGYTTCQMASSFQVRSAMGEQILQVPPQ